MEKIDYTKYTDQELKDALVYEKKQERLQFTQQLTLKLAINALYGATAQKYFALFNPDLAAAITMNSRFYVQFMAGYINKRVEGLVGNPNFKAAIYQDTDSHYFSVAPLVEKHCKGMSIEQKTEWCDRFYDKIIDPVVQNSIDDFAKITNAYNQDVIGSEREVIGDSGLFVAKKKYTIRVRDNEGTRFPVDSPYYKVTGLETQMGGTAPFAKKHLKEAIPVILDKTKVELKEWFQGVREEYAHQPLMDIAKTVGVSKLKDPKWGTLVNGRMSSPPHGSKACIVTNNYLLKNNLQEQFPLIEAGSKVKILPLLKPNPLGNAEQFAFEDHRFVELLEDYIDRDTAFEKFFVSPLENMVDVLKIDIKRTTEELDEW